jgi:hypothetical protein
MRTFMVVGLALAFALVSRAEDGSKDKYGKEALQAEKDFIADPDSPKLYTMEDALELNKKTGKPVLCWMGEHAFADFNVRKLSMELKDTTIQASMKSDGTAYDQFNPRVKFDTQQYVEGGKTYYLRAENFKFSDGANPVAVEKTTRYRILSWFDSKKFPEAKDALKK